MPTEYAGQKWNSRTRLFIAAFSIFSFYYLFVFEWMVFFDSYLLLRALNTFGVWRGWTRGIADFPTPADYVQYETGHALMLPNWYTAISTVIARSSYIYGPVSDFGAHVFYHAEFLYLSLALIC